MNPDTMPELEKTVKSLYEERNKLLAERFVNDLGQVKCPYCRQIRWRVCIEACYGFRLYAIECENCFCGANWKIGVTEWDNIAIVEVLIRNLIPSNVRVAARLRDGIDPVFAPFCSF